jgi:hypothetical protein
MSYHSELHIANNSRSPREVWDDQSDPDDGFEPTDNDIFAAMDAIHAINVLAWDERDWVLNERIRYALADAYLATIAYDVPF